jgi:hypothetical protein
VLVHALDPCTLKITQGSVPTYSAALEPESCDVRAQRSQTRRLKLQEINVRYLYSKFVPASMNEAEFQWLLKGWNADGFKYAFIA